MAEKYFSNLPKINYQNKTSRNLLVKSKFITELVKNVYIFYPYTVRDEETPEYIASRYYGSPDLDWVVYFSNEIINPYFEWVMTYENFMNYINKKYGNVQTAQSRIMYYKYNQTVNNAEVGEADLGFDYKSVYRMSPDTYARMSTTIDPSWNAGFWTAVSYYTWEEEENEKRRTIQLIRNDMIDQVLKEIEEIFA